jgi:hypothetical protein
MDIIDNLLYATYVSPINSAIPTLVPPPPPPPPPPLQVPAQVNRIISDYAAPFGALPIPAIAGTAFTYNVVDKMNFCAYEDANALESTVLRHWYDVDNQVNYDSGGITAFNQAPNGVRLVSFEDSSTYHLIGAYLLENTRILQIFERFIEKYLLDEEFGIAENPLVFDWIHNSERLFFKGDTRVSNIRSLIRPSADASRRNAYWRMLGMDLAFGDINSQSSASTSYTKARATNQEFIILFEKYLSEIWQGYINARNTAGANTSDINIVRDLAIQLREMLIARRGNVSNTTYSKLNLSREEFSSVLITSWFTFIISHDSPVVNFLNCQSSTIGERLFKIGAKVGIPAHSKCQSLFEIAGPAANILTTIEVGGVLDNAAIMQVVLSSLNPPPAIPPAPQLIRYMEDFLTIINNWEKATGHRIKNPEVNVRGMVRMQQNGASTSNGVGTSNGVKPQPALN